MTRFLANLVLLAMALAPVAVPAAEEIPAADLRAAADPALQRVLDSAIHSLGLESAVRRGNLCVSLAEITDLDRPRFAQVNGDEMMYAASLPKIGILLAAFVEIEQGRLRNTPDLQQTMTRMIRNSSNEAATQVMKTVGVRRVNEILASPAFRFYDPRTNGGLWVGKEYGAAPAFQRDPLHNISHGATAMQVARLYYLLERGQLLRPDLTVQMKEVLAKPAIQHKFVKGMSGRNVVLYRKSGTWQHWHADSMLVEAANRTYILVALADDPEGGEWLARLAPKVDDLLAVPALAANTTGSPASRPVTAAPHSGS
jgi:beta-lactamase class A